MLDQGQCGYFSQFKPINGKSFPHPKSFQNIEGLQQQPRFAKPQKALEKTIISNHNIDPLNISPQILSILQQYAKQNSRLSGQRQALFKKNCQLVNEIKYLREKFREFIYQKTMSAKLSPQRTILIVQQPSFLDHQQCNMLQQKNKINTNKSRNNQRLPPMKKLSNKKNTQQCSFMHEKSSEMDQLDITKISAFHNTSMMENQTGKINTQNSNSSQIIFLDKSPKTSKEQNKKKKSYLFSERSQQFCKSSQPNKNISQLKQKKCINKKAKFSGRVKTNHRDYPCKENNYKNSEIQSQLEKTYLYPKRYSNEKSFLSRQAQEQTNDDIKYRLHSPYQLNNQKLQKSAVKCNSPEKNISKFNHLFNNSFCNTVQTQKISNKLLKMAQTTLKVTQNKKINTNFQNKKQNNKCEDNQLKRKMMHISYAEGFKNNSDIKYERKIASIKQLDNKIKKIRTENQKLRNN